ncbi:hypothetical protein ACLX1H_008192 [Fusarium chlamydosporum]
MYHDSRSFISDIVVHYSDHKPNGTIEEINGADANINSGHGGSNVWLEAYPATYRNEYISDLRIDIGGLDSSRDDLAKGAGGDYRYIRLFREPNERGYITEVAIWRPAEHRYGPPQGWDGMSNDINARRGGDYLHLVWRLKRV